MGGWPVKNQKKARKNMNILGSEGKSSGTETDGRWGTGGLVGYY
jgi:hypothetical protein